MEEEPSADDTLMEGWKVDTTDREAETNIEFPMAVKSAASPLVEKFLVEADEKPEVGVIREVVGTTESQKAVTSVDNSPLEESTVNADIEPEVKEKDPYESSDAYFIRAWINGVLIGFFLLVIYVIREFKIGVNIFPSFVYAMAVMTILTIHRFMTCLWRALEAQDREKKMK